MSPEVITAIGVIILGTFGAFFGFMKYVVDKFLKELKPNGGSSVKDKVDTLADQVNRIEKRVDDIIDLLLKKGGK